jgi:hypothetical protein
LYVILTPDNEFVGDKQDIGMAEIQAVRESLK